MLKKRLAGDLVGGADHGLAPLTGVHGVAKEIGMPATRPLPDLLGSPDGLAAFHQRLLAIRLDPQIKGLALRYAGSPDLAEDALQGAYCGVARLKHPEEIENLRAYFCKALVHEVYRERGQLGAALVEDFVRVAETRQAAVGCHPGSPRPVDDAVCASLQAQAWLQLLADERDRLQAAVPARSDDPGRYRAVIYDAAGQVLRDGINSAPSEADSNPAFRAAYPEYFDQPGALPDTCYQRFRRARTDVRALLRAVVSPDELS
jgi:DNA-directed RNA polymerase specialized sigma24 family protein